MHNAETGRRMRAILVAIMLAVVAMAGCAETPAENEQIQESADDPGSTSEANGTAEVENQTLEELVPIVHIYAGGNLTEAVNGTYIVTEGETVTFDASNTTAESFGWTFGNITAEGPIWETNFTAGNHTVQLTVTAEGAAGTMFLDLVAINATVPEPVLVSTTSIGFSASSLGEALDCISGSQTLEFPAGTTTRRVRLVLDPSWAGIAFDVAYKVQLRDDSGTAVLKAARSGGNANLVLDESDLDLPAGTYTAWGEFCTTAAANMSFSASGSAEHYA